MAGKESVTKVQNHLENVYDVSAVDKSTVRRWALRTADSEKGQVTGGALADQQQRPLSFITTVKLAAELSVSKRSMNNILDALRYSKLGTHWVPRNLNELSQS